MVGPSTVVIGLCFFFAFVAFLIWATEIVITSLQIILVVVFVISTIVIGTVIKVGLSLTKKVKSREKRSTKAWNFIKNWWFKRAGEKLSWFEMRQTTRDYEGQVFHAFKVSRSIHAEKPGQNIVFIVKDKPLDMWDADDDPGPDRIENPWWGFNPFSKKIPVTIRRIPRTVQRVSVHTGGRKRSPVDEFLVGKPPEEK